MTKADAKKLDDSAVATAYKASVVAARAAHDHMVTLRTELYARQEVAQAQAALEAAKSRHARGGAS